VIDPASILMILWLVFAAGIIGILVATSERVDLVVGNLIPDWRSGSASVLQASANGFKEEQMNDDRFAPQLKIDHYGDGRHGLLVHDVHAYRTHLSTLPHPEVNKTQTIDVRIVGRDTEDADSAVRAVDDGASSVVYSRCLEASNLSTSAGESTVSFECDDTYNVPGVATETRNDGPTTIGDLWTRAHYFAQVISTEFAGVSRLRNAIKSRLVVVPLSEAFLDQMSTEDLLKIFAFQ